MLENLIDKALILGVLIILMGSIGTIALKHLMNNLFNNINKNRQRCVVDKNGEILIYQHNIQYKNAKGKLSHNNNNKKEEVEQYKKVIIDDKNYEELINALKSYIKNKLITRDQLLDFKEIVNSYLEEHVNSYKNFKFENDMHYLYTVLKNKHLKSDDYKDLLTILNDYKITKGEN